MQTAANLADMATGKLLGGQVALVTASTSGIGAETALRLAQAGARAVVVNGRNADTGRQVADRLHAQCPDTQFKFIAADLDDLEQVRRLVAESRDAFGRIDILVHCGGAQIKPDLFVNTDAATFAPMLQGHFMSLLYCCHCVLPIMKEQGGGAIVAVASDAGKIATPGETLIGAAKAAAIMFIRCLALEVARFGIRANVMTPSIVRETKSHARVMSGELSRKVFEKAESRARLGVPTPADVAPMIVFLASPLASKITGQAVSVNGGISAA
jgi:3-oxoacyl-[acyl-carrier protein] reductase